MVSFIKRLNVLLSLWEQLVFLSISFFVLEYLSCLENKNRVLCTFEATYRYLLYYRQNLIKRKTTDVVVSIKTTYYSLNFMICLEYITCSENENNIPYTFETTRRQLLYYS